MSLATEAIGQSGVSSGVDLGPRGGSWIARRVLGECRDFRWRLGARSCSGSRPPGGALIMSVLALIAVDGVIGSDPPPGF